MPIERNILEEQKQYETVVTRHKARIEAMARAHYAAAQLRGSDLTYEQILNYLNDKDNSDFGPSPIEWERICGNSDD